MLERNDIGIVLSKEPSGDQDLRVAILTKRSGKLIAKARSGRKITSKLSSHLEPGNVIYARLIEKNGLQVVDALKTSRLPFPPQELYLLHAILAEGMQEPAVWKHLTTSTILSWEKILAFLGWDPADAECRTCGSQNPQIFSVRSQEFSCEKCAHSQNEKDGVEFIDCRPATLLQRQ